MNRPAPPPPPPANIRHTPSRAKAPPGRPPPRQPTPLAGSFAATPLPQLMLLAQARGATGTLVVTHGDTVHRLQFVAGAAVRASVVGAVPSLRATLRALGCVSAEVLDAAATRATSTHEPLGAALLSAGEVDPALLDAIARAQILACVRALSALPPDATYELRSDGDVEGADAALRLGACDPLDAFTTAVRGCAQIEADSLDQALALLADRPLRPRADADLERFGFDHDERRVAAAILDGSPTYAALLASGVAAPGSVRRVVYALTATHHLEGDDARPDLWPPPLTRDPDAARRNVIVAAALRPTDATHYGVLGVAADASPAEIRAAHAALAAQLSPRTLPESLSGLQAAATRLSSQLARAFATLDDPTRRACYDGAISAPIETDPVEIERALATVEHQRQAEAALTAGSLAEAERLALLAAEGDPGSVEIRALVAFVRGVRGDGPACAAAIDVLDTIVAEAPGNDRLLVRRATLLRRAGRDEEALRDYRAAAELNPGNIDAARALGLGRRQDVPAPAARTARTASPTRARKIALLVAAAALATLLLGFAVKPHLRSSDDRLADALAAYGIASEFRTDPQQPLAEEQALDALGEPGVRRLVPMLTNSQRIEDGDGNHSDQTVRHTALLYLVHYAATQHVGPPTNALRLVQDGDRRVDAGSNQLYALQQQAWQAWFDAPQSRPPEGSP